MMVSRGLFGWSPPHVQPLTPVSEVSEPPESPSPYADVGNDAVPVEAEEEMEEMEEIEPPPAAVPFSKLFVYADRVDWVLMVVGSVAAAAHGTALVIYLHYFAKIVQLLVHVDEDADVLFDRFKELALTLVYIAGGVFVAGWIEVSCWILTGERQTAVIRSRYVQVLLNQDMSFFDTYGNNGDIVSQVLSDVLLIQSALSEKVGNYIHNMATFFGGLAIGFINCWQIALITLATGPFIVAAGGISNIFLHRLAEYIQDAYAEAAGVAEQAVSYVKTLYAFTNETLAKYSYAASLQATLKYGVSISLVQGLGLGFTYGLAICSCALQLYVGRFLVTHRKAHGGEIVTALFAIILSGLGLNQAATNFYSFEQGRIAAYRLFEMISRSSSTVDHNGKTLATIQGNIEFRNVYFSYLSRPEIPILSGFYLTVPSKKTVALVGRNGSGKSSIIPLMERFYDPTLGEVLLDGENIKNLNLEWLRSQIGLVTQEPALLSLSIRENIAYGRDSTSLQIEDAAKIAHAHTFITSLEKGYDTQVGRAGLSLTEEQKIRLSVARAVLLNPSILLLDEVTGGLDFEAERSVQEALDLLMLGRSTIIIARRLSLIKNADFIAVMEDGQLMEIGTHDELIASDGLYAELLRCEEAAKLPRRMPVRNHNKITTFQLEKDSSKSQSFQEPTSPKFAKSPSLQRASNLNASRSHDSTYGSHESPRNPTATEKENGLALDVTDKEPSIKRQDSFEKRLPDLPKLDIHAIRRQTSHGSNPESPISPLLTSDPQSERSHSQTYSRPNSQLTDKPNRAQPVKEKQHKKEPSIWRLIELSLAEWFYAVLGSTGAAIFGSFNPLLAYVIALIVTAYYRNEINRRVNIRDDVDKWCLIIACMGVVTVIANFLQHFYFGIMGEKMTERVRRMMFSAMLRNEVGWFDEEENSVDTLSMRLANDATFVRAAFSNRLSILVQDCSAVIVAIVIGMLLHWRLALVALATLPVLTLSAIAQKLWLAGFSKGIQEMHRKASLVLEDAVRNIYTVVAFCAGNKVMELYRLQLHKIFYRSFFHGLAIGFAFGFSQFLLFACNAVLLWYAALCVKNRYTDLPTALKEYMVFSFATFALVEPFGLAPYILKRRKSLISVFEIIDRIPKIEPDDAAGIKPPNVYGSIELKNVDFCYPTRPEVLVLSNFSLKVTGGQTVAVVGVSGSGKSTIISLIERFYDPVAGQVMLDGRDLKQFNLRWLRNNLGIVQQEPIIFSTTIRENIIYARHNASEAEIKEAARIANAHHFISNLPHGYDTHVGMRDVDLTPGQKQRIAIARVVLKNAPILLLDEASSSIESESSRVVQEALDTLVIGNKTTVLIAHRASMMRHVDNIVVLNGGRIVEDGNHDSLMAKNGLYVRLMQPHFGKGIRQHRLI
ncbi:putative Type I protein exporter [Helianthus annuus]|uniref:NHPM bacteriocin system ABC transporter, ATP-binding protein n=1 Tax=Helianthus annuus TaxID=4232 RepID=A0A251UCR6_HELAN|nr:ABC transporter B family member 6 [Helianthus annuus]KAF5799939.1 putative NHPM bacteriocin system ABC transporter, ATP-binding protein [Helianthus annuus]KAJ0564286.1 putative ABC transporter, AAA+ ATPase domain, ABC transporter type 1, transmembrane [Helianthus annuus]KAJ0729615.1 putative ABC transporter, AAA+ ATPase domain, ABC transporter type 1, transmembrane [Helianthus annuus]KAJ0905994.1 putative ATP-binding cassette subfamily C member 9, AAA+ ATPase domain-containing protein [Helia